MVKRMLRKFLNNRKGTAEVIGSVMFIVILLFFFTNVYLWHDAATKEMNDLYVKKMSASFTVEPGADSLTVKANGGSDITLSRLWIVDNVNGGRHLHTDFPADAHVDTRYPFTINFAHPTSTNPVGSCSSVNGNSITVYYDPQPDVKYSIINTLGIVKSPTTP
jgi:hypothetical protein